MNFSNTEVSKKLREIAAVYTIKGGNLFQIRAYEAASEAVEHATSEVKDLWQEGNLEQIPGLGESLRGYLDELFKTGEVKHWEELKKDISEGLFTLLDIPGIGPKTAWKLTKLGVKDKEDLEKKLANGELTKKGFSEKIAQNIAESLKKDVSKIKSNRMLLPYAYTQAEKIIDYLKNNKEVIKIDALGSLRRMVATVGDLDFAIASEKPQEVVDYITKMPGIVKILDAGDTKVNVILSSGIEADFLITKPSSYGALLQHFTGSKQHNIHLRTVAENIGLSLSEYGVKDLKTGKLRETKTEDEFYGLLKMQVPDPEIREDTGEIELALEHKMPVLVKLSDIKGDLHIHDDYPIEPSHDLGVSSLEGLVAQAKKLNYQYIGISDHSPSVSNHTQEQIVELIRKRSKYIEQYNYSHNSVRVLNLLEVDIQPDGSLSVPREGLELLDFAIASIHSSFNLDKEKMTERILKAFSNPQVKVLGHPTGRLLNQRDSYDADWPKIFEFAAKNNKALEISAFPDRLDLPDILVKIAKSYGVKFVINSDSHEVSQMEMMKFGVSVARRGWAEKKDIVNSWDWTDFCKWFNIK